MRNKLRWVMFVLLAAVATAAIAGGADSCLGQPCGTVCDENGENCRTVYCYTGSSCEMK